MALNIEFSERLKALPPYLFVEIDRAKRAAIAEGRDVINLGIGDPDLGTPPHIIDAMIEAVRNPDNHHYALDSGLPRLRQEIAAWFQNRFNTSLDPDSEIYPLIGTKEGIGHLPLGVINPGDVVALTDPAYPAYRPTIQFADGKVVHVPMNPEKGFLPQIKDIEAIDNLKMLVINYPNNPTAAVATRSFYENLVQLARKKEFIIMSDMAYSEVYYDGQPPLSILEIEGAKEVAIEFHSLSKTYYMTGWRIGWACGNATLVKALGTVKSNYDSGIFQAIQVAGIAALQSPPEVTDQMRALFQKRRDCLIEGLAEIGWKIDPPKAAFYVWAQMPSRFKNSMEASKTFLDQSDIVMTPGIGFGQNGEGYVRMALTIETERIKEAVQRIAKVL